MPRVVPVHALLEQRKAKAVASRFRLAPPSACACRLPRSSMSSFYHGRLLMMRVVAVFFGTAGSKSILWAFSFMAEMRGGQKRLYWTASICMTHTFQGMPLGVTLVLQGNTKRSLKV